MKMITLWNNSITDAGAIALANAMPHLQELRMLSLWNNKISDPGAEALAQALIKCERLKAMDIGRNPIDWPGSRALEKAVKQLKERDPKVLGLYAKKFEEIFKGKQPER